MARAEAAGAQAEPGEVLPETSLAAQQNRAAEAAVQSPRTWLLGAAEAAEELHGPSRKNPFLPIQRAGRANVLCSRSCWRFECSSIIPFLESQPNRSELPLHRDGFGTDEYFGTKIQTGGFAPEILFFGKHARDEKRSACDLTDAIEDEKQG